MEIPIIFEDSEIVVIDKPSGIVCNRADTVQGETLQDWWEGRYKISNLKFSNSQIEDEKYFLERIGLVHRLDRETSGVMVRPNRTSSGAYCNNLSRGVQKSIWRYA
jgi:23S rRNA pseudouridine1911/1915/1917 synthase